jgi:hypothetical protein
MQANHQSSSLKSGTAFCDPKFQQDLCELRTKLTESNERCIRGQISINEMLYAVDEYVKTIRELIIMKPTFSYKEYLEEVLEKYFQVLTENFPSPNPVLSRLCFEGLVRGHIQKIDYLPKVSCQSPSYMASFFFKAAHVLHQLHASQHSFFSEFTHTQVHTHAMSTMSPLPHTHDFPLWHRSLPGCCDAARMLMHCSPCRSLLSARSVTSCSCRRGSSSPAAGTGSLAIPLLLPSTAPNCPL